MKIKDLKNHFLIAMPSINDPVFKNSLILICEDNKDGTMGLIINKPIDNIINDNMIFDVEDEDLYPKNSKIYFGGPVEVNVGFVLHNSDYSTNKTLNISNELSLTSDTKVLKDIHKNNGPNNFLFTLGYAGWDKNQLSSEIKNGDWLVSPANSNCIFDDTMKTDFLSSLIGFNINDLNGQTGQA